MAFWGAVVKPGKPHAFVPPPEEWNLHLSQAAIAPTVPEGRRVALAVKSDPEDEAVIICTLTAGRVDTAALDLFFSQYAEFSVVGEDELHLTGYYTPSQLLDDDEDDEDEDEDGEYQPGALGFPIRAGDDEGDDDDEDEDDELDELGEDEDEDEDSMDVDGDDDEELFGYEAVLRSKRKPHVVIEEVTDHPEADKDGKGAAAAAGDKKAKVGTNVDKAAKSEAKEEDLEESEAEDEEDEDEENEDEDEENEDEDDEDEEEDEEEEEEAQKSGKARMPAAGSKRPADTVRATANGTTKADGPHQKKQAVGQQQQPQAQPVSKSQDKRQKAEAKQQQDEKPPKQEPQQQEPKQREPKQQQPKPQEPKQREPKQREPKQQEPKQQEPKQQEPKQQEPKQQEPKQQEPKQQKEKETKAGKKNIRSHPNGFTIEDVSYGDPKGKMAKPGQKVSMRYVGRLKANGKEFDRSGKQPFRFRLGVGEVIKGWDLGVEGMRVGDKRRLVIPPQLAYGTTGVKGTIPPNATLEFDVELLDVK